MKKTIHLLLAMLFFLTACGQQKQKKETPSTPLLKSKSMHTEIITLGNGCFWCTEAIFQQVKGVNKVTSGYSGGHVENPSYEEVCEKTTGHAEVLQVEFDTTQVTIDEILEIFWQTHAGSGNMLLRQRGSMPSAAQYFGSVSSYRQMAAP